MKIVVLDGHALNPGDLTWAGFEKFGEVTVYDRTSYTDKKEIVERIGQAEVVLTNKIPIDEEILAQTPQVNYIGVTATGFNIIELAATKKHGVTVTNIPAYGTDAVAQFTFALLLELTSQVGLHSASVHDGDWQTSPDFTYWKTPLMELAGKTIGLIGYGAIAQAVGEIAHAFKLNVIYYNHRVKTPQAKWAKQVTLAELYAQADIVSLHVPQTKETTGMIDETAIAQMKAGVLLLNTARGGLLNEAAVAQALNTGKIAGAGLDVVAKEPIAADNPLLTAKNCFLTPHIAWAPVETRSRLLQIAVDNLASYLQGETKNVVS